MKNQHKDKDKDKTLQCVGTASGDTQCHLLAGRTTQGNWVTVIATNGFTIITLSVSMRIKYELDQVNYVNSALSF